MTDLVERNPEVLADYAGAANVLAAMGCLKKSAAFGTATDWAQGVAPNTFHTYTCPNCFVIPTSADQWYLAKCRKIWTEEEMAQHYGGIYQAKNHDRVQGAEWHCGICCADHSGAALSYRT